MAATATAGHYVPADPPVYVEGPIRAFAIATTFWGVVGFLVGVVIALQLAFPLLNLDLEWTSFGRLRPVHTSPVIFAFGGNAVFLHILFIFQPLRRARAIGGDCRGGCCVHSPGTA